MDLLDTPLVRFLATFTEDLLNGRFPENADQKEAHCSNSEKSLESGKDEDSREIALPKNKKIIKRKGSDSSSEKLPKRKYTTQKKNELDSKPNYTQNREPKLVQESENSLRTTENFEDICRIIENPKLAGNQNEVQENISSTNDQNIRLVYILSKDLKMNDIEHKKSIATANEKSKDNTQKNNSTRTVKQNVSLEKLAISNAAKFREKAGNNNQAIHIEELNAFGNKSEAVNNNVNQNNIQSSTNVILIDDEEETTDKVSNSGGQMQVPSLIDDVPAANNETSNANNSNTTENSLFEDTTNNTAVANGEQVSSDGLHKSVSEFINDGKDSENVVCRKIQSTVEVNTTEENDDLNMDLEIANENLSNEVDKTMEQGNDKDIGVSKASLIAASTSDKTESTKNSKEMISDNEKLLNLMDEKVINEEHDAPTKDTDTQSQTESESSGAVCVYDEMTHIQNFVDSIINNGCEKLANGNAVPSMIKADSSSSNNLNINRTETIGCEKVSSSFADDKQVSSTNNNKLDLYSESTNENNYANHSNTPAIEENVVDERTCESDFNNTMNSKSNNTEVDTIDSAKVLSKENKILQIAKPESTVDRCLNDESECINISDTDDEENSKHQAFISNNQETKRYISADEKISKAVCIIKKDSVLEELISRNKINIESGVSISPTEMNLDLPNLKCKKISNESLDVYKEIFSQSLEEVNQMKSISKICPKEQPKNSSTKQSQFLRIDDYNSGIRWKKVEKIHENGSAASYKKPSEETIPATTEMNNCSTMDVDLNEPTSDLNCFKMFSAFSYSINKGGNKDIIFIESESDVDCDICTKYQKQGGLSLYTDCRVCCAKFKVPSSLEIHDLKHTSRSKKVCEDCRIIYESDLQNNCSLFKYQRILVCYKCNDETTEFVKGEIDMLLPNPFKCVCCGRQFEKFASFQLHMNSHKQKYECPKCFKSRKSKGRSFNKIVTY